MGKDVDEQFLKQVVASTVGDCARCSQKYDESSVSVVGHQEDLWFLSLICHGCGARGMVAALVKEAVQFSLSDLNQEEMARFQTGPEVGVDDVLDIHQFLDEFDGDFKGLFNH